MVGGWEDVEELLLGAARDDLEHDGWVQPALVAFAGDEPRFLAWLRPFAKGEYHPAFIELFALAAPLGADRLATSVSGRAWSLDDPVAPVCDAGDLRQRIVIVHRVDGAGPAVDNRGVIWPFDLDGGRVRWGERQDMGPPKGWIAEAMAALVGERHRFTASDAEIARQARRVVALGHDLYLPPDVHTRLAPPLRRG